MLESIEIRSGAREPKVLTLMRPEKSGLSVRSITGLAPSNEQLSTSDSAMIDGVRYNGSKTESRNIVITLGMEPQYSNEFGTNLFVNEDRTVEALRHEVYSLFPAKMPITLIFKTDRLKAYCIGYRDTIECDIFSNTEQATVSIVCPDPYFYEIKSDPTQITDQFTDIEPLFEFPFPENDIIEFGNFSDEIIHYFNYYGETPNGFDMSVKFGNNCTQIKITNLDTNQQIFLDGSKLPYGLTSFMKDDIVAISTRVGHKHVQLIRQNKMYNILNAFDRSSEWIEVYPGRNTFRVTASDIRDISIEIICDVKIVGL